ncbi:hypothetical protein D3C86_1383520 [compost metagenome]
MQGMADRLMEHLGKPATINRHLFAIDVQAPLEEVVNVLRSDMRYKPWTSKMIRNTKGIYVRPGGVAPVQVYDSMGITRIHVMGLTMPKWDLILKHFPLQGRVHQLTIKARKGFSEVRGYRSDKSESALPLKELAFVLERETPRLHEKTYVSREHDLILQTWDKSAGYDDFVIADTSEYRDLL